MKVLGGNVNFFSLSYLSLIWGRGTCRVGRYGNIELDPFGIFGGRKE